MLELNKVHNIECLAGLKEVADKSMDCCVTDPPYGIRFMDRKWDYDIPSVAVWKEVWRVLKPGAHMLVGCGTRTQHRMATNIEDAGFRIRDVITWHYGSGFPKSLDIGKAIKKMEVEAGAMEAEAIRKWEGWGTALKPATEFWTLARKPLEGTTVVENVLRHGVGGLNIDDSRIDLPHFWSGADRVKSNNTLSKVGGKWHREGQEAELYWGVRKPGRYPANLILDEFMAQVLDDQSGWLVSGQPVGKRKAGNNVYGQYALGQDLTGYGDAGGASRFFYVAKADAAERGAGNYHPTVKPLSLMHYLIRLICPVEEGRVVLEPYAGSGSTCIAARMLGLDFVAFEIDAGYVRIAEVRLRNELGLFF